MSRSSSPAEPSPPLDLRPMKAVAAELPTGHEWAYEVKWDGMRVIAVCDHGRLHLHSANMIDVTERFGELTALADELNSHGVVLDGEVVAFGEAGRPDFGRLQSRMHVASAAAAARRAADVPVTYLLFDVLWLDGHDVCDLPYLDRRRLLEALVDPGPCWQVPAWYPADGGDLLAAVTERGLEGLVAKRVDSRYVPGRRSPDWRKIKVRRRQELVVVGWLEGDGGLRGRLGALVVACHDDEGRLVYWPYAMKLGMAGVGVHR